ncbi:MAG: histidine phosphatase family protein [Pseudomonadota bacterium]
MAHSLLLVRHGQIQANRDGIWHGSTDSPLLPRGRLQARKVGLAVGRRSALEGWHLSAAYSSPLQRCRHTATLALFYRGSYERSWLKRLANRLSIPSPDELDVEPHLELLPELREYGIGEWEGTSFKDLARDHQFVGRAIQDPDFAPPGGESLRQVSQRVASALRTIDSRHGPDERVLVCSHGAALAIGLATLLNSDPTLWVDYPLSNCSLSELRLSGAPELRYFNQVAHL